MDDGPRPRRFQRDGHQIWVGTVRRPRGGEHDHAGAKPGVLIRDLRPKVPFFFWVTYRDAAGKTRSDGGGDSDAGGYVRGEVSRSLV